MEIEAIFRVLHANGSSMYFYEIETNSMKFIRFHKKVVNSSGGHALSGFLLILFLLLGRSMMGMDHHAVDPNSTQSVGLVYGIGHRVHPTAALTLLLEETDDSSRFRSKHSPAPIGLLTDRRTFFDTYCCSTYQKGRITTPSFTIYSPPKYILFHSLFIPC